MFEAQPLLITTENIPQWMAVSFYAFWVGLPALLRWLLNVQNDPS